MKSLSVLGFEPKINKLKVYCFYQTKLHTPYKINISILCLERFELSIFKFVV